jgi:hypothetical protein
MKSINIVVFLPEVTLICLSTFVKIIYLTILALCRLVSVDSALRFAMDTAGRNSSFFPF